MRTGSMAEAGVAPPAAAAGGQLWRARLAQAAWAQSPLSERLGSVRRLRHLIAGRSDLLVAAVGDRHGRTPAETLATEVIPLADACRFLERGAARLLQPRRLGRRGRPLWLAAAEAEIRRAPPGVVLILAPANYPLFLPGVQLLHGLVAGNAVLVKPAPGCTAPLEVLSGPLNAAGLPPQLVRLLDDEVASARAVIAEGVDHVVLTGSAATGRAVLADLAPRLTPATLELSGNDAVFVLPGADLALVADALAFGLRLNGGATRIAPRRVFVPEARSAELEQLVQARLVGLPPVEVAASTLERLGPLLAEARGAGCRLTRAAAPADAPVMSPVLVADASPELGLLKADIFAPVLALVPVRDFEQALEFDALCPYALGASVFGPEQPARRLPFGGRGQSGFGVTRGAEGLLELTRLKVISLRRGRLRPHYQPATAVDRTVFRHYLGPAHGPGRIGRIRAWFSLLAALGRRARALSRTAADGTALGQRK